MDERGEASGLEKPIESGSIEPAQAPYLMAPLSNDAQIMTLSPVVPEVVLTPSLSAPLLAPAWVRFLTWVAVAAFLVATGAWLFRAGMKIRDDAFSSTRTIRFHGDISNAYHWGDLVLRTAEELAAKTAADRQKTRPDKNAPAEPTALANPEPGNKDQRALSYYELMQGLDQVYQNLVDQEPGEGDYGLDYPPFRLATMTLWVRHTEKTLPNLTNWPGRYVLHYSATSDPHNLFSEEIARPLLAINAYAVASASVFTFFLTWVWVHRGGRPTLGSLQRVNLTRREAIREWFGRFGSRKRRQLVPWRAMRLIDLGGILAFVVTSVVFLYAMLCCVTYVPAPAPVVQLTAAPLLTQQENGKYTAVLTGLINPQGGVNSSWNVDWTTDEHFIPGVYSQHTGTQGIGDSSISEDFSATLRDLTAGATVHYRVTARNESPFPQALKPNDAGRGVTHGEDESFVANDSVQPLPNRAGVGWVWLQPRHYVGIALLFGLMCLSIRLMHPTHRGWACGLIAGSLLWLDPSVIIDAHVWPQWDVWVIPFFLCSFLLASIDCWFVAGLVLGVGSMFKGQILLVAPLLILWPLMSFRIGAVFRLASGFILMVGIILFPWLAMNNQPFQSHWGPVRFIACVLMAGIIGVLLSFFRIPILRLLLDVRNDLAGAPRPAPAVAPTASSPAPVMEVPQQPESVYTADAVYVGPDVHRAPVLIPDANPGWWIDLAFFAFSFFLGTLFIGLLILRRWPSDSDISRQSGVSLLLSILIVPWFIRRRAIGVWLALLVGVSIVMSGSLYHGDMAWKTVGFEYGTRKFTRMALGIGSNGNLPTILEQRWGWQVHMPAYTLLLPDVADKYHVGTRGPDGVYTGFVHDWGLDGTPVTLDIRQFLQLTFFGVLILCGLGAGVQARRNDPRIVASFAAAWTLMPQILCQMAARYQLWAGAMSCALIAISPGLTMLHFIVSLLAAGMIGAQLMQFDPTRSPNIHDLLTRWGPDDGWIMMLCGLVFLYISLAPGRRPSASDLAPGWQTV